MEMVSSKERVITVLATDALAFVMRIGDTRCMKFRTSFRGKLLLLTILPLAAAQIVTLFAVMRTVQEDVDRRARESLVIGGAVVNEFLTGRSEQLRANVEILAADLTLKQAVGAGDVDVIQLVLSNHSQRVGADIALLLDLDGTGIASSSGTPPGSRTDFLRLIENVREKSSAESTATLDGDTYHTFTIPVRAPVAIAWAVLGFRIDTELAQRLGGLTGLEVSLVSTSGDDAGTIAMTS